jgi:hypothetical protein
MRKRVENDERILRPGLIARETVGEREVRGCKTVIGASGREDVEAGTSTVGIHRMTVCVGDVLSLAVRLPTARPLHQSGQKGP